MSSINFEFGNAVSHFQKTGGPKGFLWKFGLAYGLASLLLQAASGFFLWPMYAVSFNPALANDPYAMEEIMMESLGQIMIGYLLMVVLGILIWMMFEAASQRRYMRAEGFSLKLGGDEWRLLVVGLLFLLLFIGLYIAGLIVIAMPTALIGAATENMGLTMLIALVLGLGYFLFALWTLARFSPAAALTVRDQSIQFGKAWSVSKGKGWTIVGSWIVLLLLWMVILFVFYFLFILVIVAGMMGAMSGMDPAAAEDPAVIMGMILSPGFLIPGILFLLGYMFLAAIMMHVFGGPAALAARTDPSYAGETPETFS